MTLASVILLDKNDAEAATRTLLGAPVAIRALAATLLPGEAMVSAVVAPASIHDRLLSERARFGFEEARHWFEPDASPADALRQALAVLPADADVIIIHHGLMALFPTSAMEALVAQARQKGAAISVTPITEPAFAASSELAGEPVPGPLHSVSFPAAFTRAVLTSLLETPGPRSVAQLAAQAQASVLPLDRDALLVRDESDITRALEAWGRRAPHYAFIWPKPGALPSMGQPAQPPSPPAQANVTVPDRPA